MNTNVKYDLEAIKEEARRLVSTGELKRNQPIYTLCKYIPGTHWICVELELEKNDFLLRDKIIDLMANEEWREDK